MKLCIVVPTLMLAYTITFPALAIDCRSAAAAKAGAQAGYERDLKAAEAWALRERQVSSELQQCLGNISSAVTVPKFPNLSGILNRIKDKVCRTAREKIQRHVPSHIDPWNNLPSRTGGWVDTTSNQITLPQSYSPTIFNESPAATSPPAGEYLFTR